MDMLKLQKKMRQVPFGNSIFQIEHFSRGLETPERTYRNCLLQLNQKLRAMKECEFRRQRLEIDIAELKDRNAESFEKQRLRVDLEEKQFALDEEIKLIEDCVIEIKVFENIINQLPDYTREDFEKAEGVYWEKKLLADMKNEVISLGHVQKDTLQSLAQIGIKVGRNEKGEISYIKEDKNDNFLCFDPSVANRGDKAIKSEAPSE